MAVFRVEKTRDFTIMSIIHFKDKRLSLKAKGLLSLMLSLPDEWDFSLYGLTKLGTDGIDGIRKAVNELEVAGYIIRARSRNEKGQLKGTEYIIYEHPASDLPTHEKPALEKPTQAKPTLEKPVESNINIVNKYQEITNSANIDSIPFRSDKAAVMPPESKGSEAMLRDIEIYREIIRENIDYDNLRINRDIDRLDELVELMTETVCSKRKYIRVSGSDFPHEMVKSRLLKLDGEHINFVLDCLDKNTSEVRNIKQYLLATLFNAPTTIGNYYSSLVNHDLNHDLE